MSAAMIGARLRVGATAHYTAGCMLPQYNNHIRRNASPKLPALLQHQTLNPLAPIQKRHFQLIPDVVRTYYLTPDFPPIGGIIQLLTSVHEWTGLPWWASIAVTTIGLRTMWTLPLSIYGQQLANRRQLLKPELDAIKRQTVNDVQHIMKYHKWNSELGGQAMTAQMKEVTRELYKRDNCHPLKLLMIPFMQVPLWLSFSFALRNMAGFLPLRGQNLPVLCPDMAFEGTLWFSNLLIPDSFMILVVATTIMNLINLEISVLSIDDTSRFIRFGNNCARFFSLWLLPISAYVPSVVVWYWFLSALTGMVQNIVLRFPKVRTVIGIKKVPNDTDTPFKDIMTRAKKRYWLREKQEKQEEKIVKLNPETKALEREVWQRLKAKFSFRKREDKKEEKK